MKEQDAIEQIKSQCNNSSDYEANGCNLDNIIKKFLMSQGFKELANEMDNVECWRA